MSTSLSPQRDADRRPSETGKDRLIPATATEVAAAKLRVTLDRRLGRTTPRWVIKLANAERRSPGRPAGESVSH